MDFEGDTSEMALRYLGPKVGETYLVATYPDGTSNELLVRLRPERRSTADFRKYGTGS